MVKQSKIACPSSASEASDFCSGWYNMFIGLGQTTGAIFGSYSTKRIGFKSTQDLVAAGYLFIGVIYYACCKGR